MGLFDSFNPLDPLGLLGGSGLPGGGGGGGDAAGGGLSLGIGGGPDAETKDKANEFDAKKAYGFGGAGDSQFNQMRKQQLGMGSKGE